MEQLSTMNQIFDIMSQKVGIIGIHARPAMGKTTLMLQIVDDVNKRKDGNALIFSMAERQAKLKQRMQQMNVSCDRVVIDDVPHPTAEHMETRIKQVGKVSILCIDYLQLLEQAAQQKYSLTYDFFALIRQEEGCIGAEFIVKKCWHWDPVNVFMEWDDREKIQILRKSSKKIKHRR